MKEVWKEERNEERMHRGIWKEISMQKEVWRGIRICGG